MLGKCSFAYDIDRIYTKFKGSGLCAGFMNNFTPYLMPLSAEILKEILITHFKNFRNSDFSSDAEKNHTVISLNPFWLRNEKWKAKRSELSPAVTVSRLKAMYPLVVDAAKEFGEYITTKMAETPSMTFDIRDISMRYSCNAIVSTTYGLNAEAYDENTSEILENGMNVWRSISKASWLPSSPITHEVNQYFIALANQAVNRRRYNNEQRNDLLNYFINLKDKRNLSDLETASHAMTFFLDGFETSSLALCYTLFELSRNQSAQQKLRMEINDAITDPDVPMPIETLSTLTYLDQVFYEAIRLHPPLYYTTRLCNETIELSSDSGEKILVPNDTAILIPIYSIHRDPDTYESPHEFIPERFDEENGGVKAFRDKCALIPFGDSGRICLGMNLGTLQIKSAVVELLRHFELICCDSVTEDDARILPNNIANLPNGKLMVRFKELGKE